MKEAGSVRVSDTEVDAAIAASRMQLPIPASRRHYRLALENFVASRLAVTSTTPADEVKTYDAHTIDTLVHTITGHDEAEDGLADLHETVKLLAGETILDVINERDELRTPPSGAAVKDEPDYKVIALTLAPLAVHSKSCLSSRALPDGSGYWHCTCGLASIVLDGELLDTPQAPTAEQKEKK